jgi:type III secretion protein T
VELAVTIDQLSSQALTIGLAAIRVSVAFILLPLFSEQLIPPLIRNAIFLAVAVMVVILHPVIDVTQFTPLMWLQMIAKEAFLGVCLGAFFGLFLWAFEAAGQIIDSQIGMNMAQVFDPLEGHETSLIGSFIGRFINYIFIAMGGLMYFTGIIMQSYGLWPIDSALPDIPLASVRIFEVLSADLFALIVVVAGPFLVIAFLIDICMGMINRESQQFNVFFLSMPLKTLAAVFVLILSLGYLMDLLVDKTLEHNASVLQMITAIFSAN